VRIAFYTFGQLLEAADHPAMLGFVARNDRVFSVAERSLGFIARSGYEGEIGGPPSWGPQVYPRFCVATGDADPLATLSLWEDLESVFAFAYTGAHAEALRRRHEWFCAPRWPSYVAWWVTAGHRPDWDEAAGRLERLHGYGPGPRAFDFKRAFGPDGKPAVLDKAGIAGENRPNSAGAG